MFDNTSTKKAPAASLRHDKNEVHQTAPDCSGLHWNQQELIEIAVKLIISIELYCNCRTFSFCKAFVQLTIASPRWIEANIPSLCNTPVALQQPSTKLVKERRGLLVCTKPFCYQHKEK